MYLRVSEILARLQNFAGIAPEILQNKANIGTNVHRAIYEDSIGDFPMLETERERAYFKSYLLWKNKIKPEFAIQTPRLYCNELMITGEIDALTISPEGHLVLTDWKCSAEPNEKIWKMQAHFYWYLLHVNNINVSERMLWVNLRQEKWYEYGADCTKIARYTAVAPKLCEFFFSQEVLSDCIQEAIKAWEEKKDSLVVDFN